MKALGDFQGLRESLANGMVGKFIATRNAEGVPNIVPLTSIMWAEDKGDILFFGNFLLRKTVKNLEQDRRCRVLVITEGLDAWIIPCDFMEFQRTGEFADRQNNTPLLRYNAYTGIRNAGIMRAHGVERAFTISKPVMAAGFLAAKVAAAVVRGGGIEMPLPARGEFAKIAAVKVLSWIGDDGRPVIETAMSLQPAGARSLLCLTPKNGPRDGRTVAANVLTLDAVSYQVKGTWKAGAFFSLLEATDVYAGGPPLPGGKVA
jgi:hypothetical protein